MGNHTAVVPATETTVAVTLESVLAAMSDKERMELLLDSKKLAALKKSLPKADGHKVNIIKALKVKPMTDAELAKECSTTVKTIQSYVCYLNDDAKSADIKHKADPVKNPEAGVHIMLLAGKRTILSSEMKKVLGLA